MGLIDALRRQPVERPRHQRPADALPAPVGSHHHVMQVAAAAVVATEDAADQPALPLGHQAQTGVTRQIAGNRLRRIGRPHGDPRRAAHQGHYRGVVIGRHWADVHGAASRQRCNAIAAASRTRQRGSLAARRTSANAARSPSASRRP